MEIRHRSLSFCGSFCRRVPKSWGEIDRTDLLSDWLGFVEGVSQHMDPNKDSNQCLNQVSLSQHSERNM